MTENNHTHSTLTDKAARQLANTTKTIPQYPGITPRWLVKFLEWKPLESGTLRINRVRENSALGVACDSSEGNGSKRSFLDYEESPREHTLNSITTIVDVHTRVSDLFSTPIDQIKEQLRLASESIKEQQESELVNNNDYGLMKNVAPSQRISTLKGAPTPDDMDELIEKVWKEPAFFLAHPKAIAAFGRECTYRGVPPPTINLFGNPFLTWRGLPLVPSDKLQVENGKTNILLLRVGEKKQGVIGLYQPGLTGEQTPGLSIRFMGINREAIASYLVSLYCSAAILVPDAIGLLENVEIGKYHEYK